jgi:hypothetical protein
MTLMEKKRSNRIEMGAKIRFMHPIIILNDYDGIVRRNIGLIEYEGLLL